MLGHLIYNHEHFDDLRVQQEISKGLYIKEFRGTHIVHAYNGDRNKWPKPYLEDKCLYLKNRGHFAGASDLINAGLDYFTRLRKPEIRYVLVTAADTWMIDIGFLSSLVTDMKKHAKVLAASSWGSAVYPQKPAGFSVDFFVIDIEWNRRAKIFPIDYDGFSRKFSDLFYFLYSIPTVEHAFQYEYQKYFATHFQDNTIWRTRDKSLRRIIEREPVQLGENRQRSWPNIGLYTDPSPAEKREALKKKHYDFGKYSHKLLYSTETDYYNKR